jgi:uncharacterized membrane protein
MPPWQYALAGLMALVIFAVCLFPLAPSWLRSVVVYFFLGLLGGIFALILVRFLLFLVVFAFIGVLPVHHRNCAQAHAHACKANLVQSASPENVGQGLL